MTYIPLDRRFVEWNETEAPDQEMRHAFGPGDVGIGWDELLLKSRVVVLAEAGSGKSEELRERARQLVTAGHNAFLVTVTDVGNDGLEAAIGPSKQQFALWRESAEDAWIFVDSVDEAKASGIRLERVVRKIAEGIQGAEGRAHVILSGRISD